MTAVARANVVLTPTETERLRRKAAACARAAFAVRHADRRLAEQILGIGARARAKLDADYLRRALPMCACPCCDAAVRMPGARCSWCDEGHVDPCERADMAQEGE